MKQTNENFLTTFKGKRKIPTRIAEKKTSVQRERGKEGQGFLQ